MQNRPYNNKRLRELIRKGQELDPFCKTVVSALHWTESDKEPQYKKGSYSAATSQLSPLRRDDVATNTGKKAWPTPYTKRRTFEDKGFTVSSDRLLLRNKRVYVPPQEAIRHKLLYLFYDCLSAGHWGVQKTLDLIQRHYTWPGIKKDMQKYIETCAKYQAKAIHRHKPYGQLEPIPIPTDPTIAPFKEISLDWITGLPEAEKGG